MKNKENIGKGSIVEICLVILAGFIVFVSEVFLKNSVVVYSVLKFIGHAILLIILYTTFFKLSLDGDFMIGFVISLFILYIYQFVACGDDYNVILNLVYILITVLLLIWSGQKAIKTKSQNVVRAFQIISIALMFVIALFIYLYCNLSDDFQNFFDNRDAKRYFSTFVFLCALNSTFCGWIQFKLDLHKKEQKTDILNDQLEQIEQKESFTTEHRKKKKVHSKIVCAQVSLKEIRDTFYHLRDFEISNLWQRSLFLSAFLVLLFTVYGNIVYGIFKGDYTNGLVLSEICCGLALAGFMFSLIWIMMGKGSKAWYEIYEWRICEIEKEDDLGIPEDYRMGASSSPWGLDENIYTNKAGKYSPSKLNIMIGRVLAIIWFIILVIHYVYAIINLNDTTIHTVILTLLPVAFLVILMTALCNSWAKSNAIGES